MHRIPLFVFFLLACRLYPQQPQSLFDVVNSVFPPGPSRPCAFFIDKDLIAVPSLAGTAWDRPEVEAWVRKQHGCRPVTIRKGNGFRYFDVFSRTLKKDSVFIEGRHFYFGDKLELVGVFSLVTNKRGDTLAFLGQDSYEEFGALDSYSDSRLRFTGRIVSAAANACGPDTLIFQAKTGRVDTCFHSAGMYVLAHAHDIMSGGCRGKKILKSAIPDTVFCNAEASLRAARLLNEELKPKPCNSTFQKSIIL